MNEGKFLPLSALVPGGDRFREFQPDQYVSIMVRDHLVALVDGRGDLYLYWVEKDVPKLKYSSSCFSHELLSTMLELESLPVDSFSISGISLSEGNMSLFLLVADTLARVDVRAEKMELVWKMDISDWLLTSTDGEGNYIYASKDKEEIRFMGCDGRPKVVYTEQDSSYTIRKTPSRQEFGIEQMFFLSPDKRKVAFYRLNETSVSSFPVTSSPDGSLMPSTTMLKYPLAGTKHSEIVEVGIVDIEDGRLSWLRNDGSICYWIGLSWSPDSQSLFSFCMNRSQQCCRLLRYDVSLGEIAQNVLCEENEKYVEQQCSLLFIDDDRFLFQSRTFSGYNHIYLYDLMKGEMTQVTSGPWEVTSLLGYSETRDAVLYLSTKNSPLNRDFFATKLSDGTTTQLSSALGTHHLFMDGKGPVWVDVYEASDVPCVTTLGCLDTYGDISVLKRAVDPYENYELPERIEGILPKADASDDDIYYRIVKPKNVPKGERLPVVFYVYGGPHVQLITNKWGSGTKGFEEMMAQSGCVVFYIDPHGSYNRGFAFESVVRDDLNGPQMRDYKYALNWLFLTHDDVDRNRVAVYGWSFGGFMTLSMLLRSGFPFKVGVAGGAVVSWRYYETMYTERYMSLDKEGGTSGEHFDRTDMARYVADLKCPLHLIHCTEDPVVLPLHLQYLLAAFNKCPSLNSLVDCYLYPGHGHNVSGSQRVNLMEKVRSMIFCSL